MLKYLFPPVIQFLNQRVNKLLTQNSNPHLTTMSRVLLVGDVGVEDDVPAPFGVVIGENGCPAYDESALSPLLALFTKVPSRATYERPSYDHRGIPHGHRAGGSLSREQALRDATVVSMRSSVLELIRVIRSNPEEAVGILVDAILVMFHSRDVRGPGKGERDMSYGMFIALLPEFPDVMISLLRLFPHYGFWGDLPRLCISARRLPEPLQDRLLNEVARLFAEALHADDFLAAKFAPSEKLERDRVARGQPSCISLVKRIAKRLSRRKPLQVYRKTCTTLRHRVTEVTMSAKPSAWDTIDPKSVTPGCLKKKRKALLNEAVGGTVIRYPHRPDRVACREAILHHLTSRPPKAIGTLFPHEIVGKIYDANAGCYGFRARRSNALSEADHIVLQSQWDGIVKNMVDRLTDPDHLDTELAGDFVCLCDVSGSMSGDPMVVAIALTILFSGFGSPAFKNKLITFESTPKLVTIPDAPLVDKVRVISSAPWGGSTDFVKAMDLILQTAIRNRVPPANMPKFLMVLSDMMFDQAESSHLYSYGGRRSSPKWATMHNRLTVKFRKHGYEIPTMVYWNLRDTGTAPVTGSHPGAILLSGFSPSMLEVLLSGRLPMSSVPADHGDAVLAVTPAMAMHETLAHSAYDQCRGLLSEMGGIMTPYHWDPPPPPLEDGEGDGAAAVAE